jgi:hypothetical protein
MKIWSNKSMQANFSTFDVNEKVECVDKANWYNGMICTILNEFHNGHHWFSKVQVDGTHVEFIIRNDLILRFGEARPNS